MCGRGSDLVANEVGDVYARAASANGLVIGILFPASFDGASFRLPSHQLAAGVVPDPDQGDPLTAHHDHADVGGTPLGNSSSRRPCAVAPSMTDYYNVSCWINVYTNGGLVIG